MHDTVDPPAWMTAVTLFLMIVLLLVCVAAIAIGFWWAVVFFTQPEPYSDPDALATLRAAVDSA